MSVLFRCLSSGKTPAAAPPPSGAGVRERLSAGNPALAHSPSNRENTQIPHFSCSSIFPTAFRASRRESMRRHSSRYASLRFGCPLGERNDPFI
jgi:hypothetical protein